MVRIVIVQTDKKDDHIGQPNPRPTDCSEEVEPWAHCTKAEAYHLEQCEAEHEGVHHVDLGPAWAFEQAVLIFAIVASCPHIAHELNCFLRVRCVDHQVGLHFSVDWPKESALCIVVSLILKQERINLTHSFRITLDLLDQVLSVALHAIDISYALDVKVEKKCQYKNCYARKTHRDTLLCLWLGFHEYVNGIEIGTIPTVRNLAW